MQALAVVLALAGAPSVPASPDRSGLLSCLHDGRFEAADRILGEAGTPTHAEDLFFKAFTTYWRLVFDDESTDLRTVLDSELDAAIAASEEAADRAEDGDAALWGGSSHLLLAELRASQRRPFSAAFEAKKAKKLLESASIAGQDTSDALFGLGTYNYVADIVPSYVKGLRALLFLPKGNRALGLDQLATAAASSRYFSFEARTLLITVFSSKHERLYRRSVEERNRLLEAYPDTIASAYASARLDISLGRYDVALARVAQAEARARLLGDVDPVVLRSIDLLRARAELASLRPDLAEATTARALGATAGLTPDIRKDLQNIRDAASREAAGVAWPEPSAERSPAQEAELFAALAEAHVDRPILALLAGDARLKAGSAQEALDWFARVPEAGLPSDLQAGRLFRQGQAADLLGRRSQAVELYAKVASTPGFVARDGAFYYQQSPYGQAP